MDDLKYRLRCKYPRGPMINGEPEFGWRDFGGPAPEGMVLPSPIMQEAADRIERLEKALEKIASLTQDDNLLWWQIEARKALSA